MKQLVVSVCETSQTQMKTRFSFADYIAIIGGFQIFCLKVAECNSAKTAFRRFHDNGYNQNVVKGELVC